VTKVADMARAAGERWRAMSEADKVGYQALSIESKARFAAHASSLRMEAVGHEGGCQRAIGSAPDKTCAKLVLTACVRTAHTALACALQTSCIEATEEGNAAHIYNGLDMHMSSRRLSN